MAPQQPLQYSNFIPLQFLTTRGFSIPIIALMINGSTGFCLFSFLYGPRIPSRSGVIVVLFVCVPKQLSRRRKAVVEVEVEAPHRRNNLVPLRKPVQPHNLASLWKLGLASELLVGWAKELRSGQSSSSFFWWWWRFKNLMIMSWWMKRSLLNADSFVFGEERMMFRARGIYSNKLSDVVGDSPRKFLNKLQTFQWLKNEIYIKCWIMRISNWKCVIMIIFIISLIWSWHHHWSNELKMANDEWWITKDITERYILRSMIIITNKQTNFMAPWLLQNFAQMPKAGRCRLSIMIY